jgi:hypothetical protein
MVKRSLAALLLSTGVVFAQPAPEPAPNPQAAILFAWGLYSGCIDGTIDAMSKDALGRLTAKQLTIMIDTACSKVVQKFVSTIPMPPEMAGEVKILNDKIVDLRGKIPSYILRVQWEAIREGSK